MSMFCNKCESDLYVCQHCAKSFCSKEQPSEWRKILHKEISGNICPNCIKLHYGTNVKLKEDFKQVCVWPACAVGIHEEEQKAFEKLMKEKMNVRVQYLEEIKTEPDFADGFPVSDTGGRDDLFFAVHPEDIPHFAIPRLQIGIRWIEDVYGNDHGDLYPERVSEYRSW